MCFVDSVLFVCTTSLQRVYPAFQTMLRHLRHISFENFKKELEQSLKNGKGFALSVNECTSHTMNGFERGFTGKKFLIWLPKTSSENNVKMVSYNTLCYL